MKTYTADELIRAAHTVNELREAEARFERAKSPQMIATNARRLVCAWGELCAAQADIGFEFHQSGTAGGANAPCSVRAARAVLSDPLREDGDMDENERINARNIHDAFARADEEWQRQLVEVWGEKDAADARYRSFGRGQEGTPLRRAYEDREAARIAWEAVK